MSSANPAASNNVLDPPPPQACLIASPTRPFIEITDEVTDREPSCLAAARRNGRNVKEMVREDIQVFCRAAVQRCVAVRSDRLWWRRWRQLRRCTERFVIHESGNDHAGHGDDI